VFNPKSEAQKLSDEEMLEACNALMKDFPEIPDSDATDCKSNKSA
jgi:hypothetical protein